jgi:hypothetical protein
MSTKKSEQSEQTEQTSILTVTDLKIIDLLDIANRLIADNESVKKKAKSSKTPVIILGASLSKKFPELKPLDDTPLISIREKDGLLVSLIPCIYRNPENDTAVVCLPDINASITDLFEVVSFKTGKNNHSILKHDNVLLKGAIATNQDYAIELSNLEIDGHESEGLPDSSILRDRPSIELPLHTIPLQTVFKIISKGKKTKKHDTEMIDIVSEKDKTLTFYNVICNAELSRLIETGCKKFKLTEHIKLSRNVEKIDDYGKKKKVTEEFYKTLLVPIDGVSLSDIEI